MATGRDNKLTGAAGELLVAAELCRRGHLATPFAGNVPEFDVVAVGQSGRQALVQVKASNTGRWAFTATKLFEVQQDGDRQSIGDLIPSAYPNLVWVLVWLGAAGEDGYRARDRFFAMPYTKAQSIIADHLPRVPMVISS